MNILGRFLEQWEALQAGWTAREILQQPDTWMKTLKQMEEMQPALQEWISPVTGQPAFTIIFTGAGSSEFVGNSIYQYLGPVTGWNTKSCPSTDVCAEPSFYINPDKPVLLVNFGRSGNSPESTGSVQTANSWSDKVQHLLITCNKDGDLAKLAQENPNCFDITLCDETCDTGFAMTSSFTNMMLSALLTFDYENLAKDVPLAAEKVRRLLSEDWKILQEIVDTFDFERIVYLGSIGLKGIAQESALKMCELTGGIIDVTFDTPMGFRHGPKSVINDETLTVLYMSDDAYTRQYEMDILKEMGEQKKGNKILVVSSREDEEARKYADWFISLENGQTLPHVLLGLEYVPVAQMLGLMKSAAMEHTPDNPCPTGEVNRVVQGVTIYPYRKEERA